MARGTDYIPTMADLIGKREEEAKRRDEAKARGFRLGTYKVKYMLFGKPGDRTLDAFSQAEAIEQVKKDFGNVGLYPYDIEAEIIVQPNVYV